MYYVLVRDPLMDVWSLNTNIFCAHLNIMYLQIASNGCPDNVW